MKPVILELKVDEESYQKVSDSIEVLRKQALKLEVAIKSVKEAMDGLDLSNLISFQKHDHICHCGTGEPNPHETGTGGCVRYMTVAPVRVGENWLVDGHEVTDFTLHQQRGYHQHPCGCWSCSPGSSNSLPDET